MSPVLRSITRAQETGGGLGFPKSESPQMLDKSPIPFWSLHIRKTQVSFGQKISYSITKAYRLRMVFTL